MTYTIKDADVRRTALDQAVSSERAGAERLGVAVDPAKVVAAAEKYYAFLTAGDGK